MKVWRLAIALAVLGAAGGAIWYGTRPRPLEVSVRAAERGVVEALVANTRAGGVRAERRARLATLVGGRVAAVHVREGQSVEAGAVLLELWNDDLEAELRLAREELRQAEAALEEARARADRAAREAKRIAALRERDVASEDQAERARADADAAAARVRAAEAAVGVQRARVALAEAHLARTVLTAPFAGVVAEVDAEVGEIVTPSPPGIPTPPAVDLLDPTALYVLAPIDEVDAPAVRVGMPVRVTLDAFGERVLKGRVRRIAPYVADRARQARTVDVEVELQERPRDPPLLAGYSADVEIVVGRREDALRVPTEAVLEDGSVLVLDPATSTLVRRPIERGLSSWRYTEVRSGLREGELVVVSLDQDGVLPGVHAVARTESSTSR